MNKQDVLRYFSKKYGDRYIAYPFSVKSKEDNYFFMAKDNQNKYLVVIGAYGVCKGFEAINLKETKINENDLFLKICYLNHYNLESLRKIFPHLNPSFCGLKPSFGTGARLGIATPAHLPAFARKNIFPVLAQQSVREMARTERNWQKVLDDVIWGCFEAGYEGPFGADADHVKNIKELKEAVDCGFTMFTIDPSDFIRIDLEISVDETPTVTSPLAHLFIVLEFKRRGVNFQNLALHFLGDWQKGIEYIGDVKQFAKEFSLHAILAKTIGGYKLSLHTGSDKFSVYPIFSRETGGLCHIKTAGTSWLEEAKVIAMKDPALYRG